MTITHCVTSGPLLAGTLGVAAFGAVSAARSAPPPTELQREIVVTARSQSDSAMTARVSAALQNDPYIFSGHVTVTTENGVVRVGGLVNDVRDLFAILRLARRIAGKGRVVSEIEFAPSDDDGN